ncbi:hypothetical protein O181_108830 [Austropuccinia psidii MF-1]|uniref:Uncharacterized protein n=1 Tax=Austropuccinia psidii MF-1 TaxID=1389203 RepID=A0A9Q3JT59_9BASI|nr:hypothetical protein [Austropuccinia psidii MF-1]
MTPALDKEGPLESKSSKMAPEKSQDNPKGPQKKQRDPRNNQEKANLHRPDPQGYRIPKFKPSYLYIVFNMARTIMEFTAKEQERINRNFKCKL